MRIRVIALACIVGIAAACDPGEPDVGYGTASIASFPHGRAIGLDGTAYGLEPVGPLASTTRLSRLNPSGRLDGMWAPEVEGIPDAVIPAADGSIWVLTLSRVELYHRQLALVRADGSVVWDDLHLGPIVPIHAVVVDGRLRLLVRVYDGDRVSLQLLRVGAEGEVVRTVLSEEDDNGDPADLNSGMLAADGSVLVAGSEPVTEETVRAWLLRFTPDGVLDRSFGLDGELLVDSLDPPPCVDRSTAMLSETFARSGSGPWIVWRCEDGAATIARLTVAGTLDRSWSSGQLAEQELPGRGSVLGFHAVDDGTVYIERACYSPVPNCAGPDAPDLVRLLPTGAVDLDWGDQGVAHLFINPTEIVPTTTGVMMWGWTGPERATFQRLVGPEIGGLLR